LGRKIILKSDLTLQELEQAPSKVQQVLHWIPSEYKEFMPLYDEAKF